MIFDKDLYDRSLWLMLKTDKKNREKIIKFVRSIPRELREQIKKSIYIYKEKIKDNDELFDVDDDRLSGNIENSRHVLYWYNISSLDGSLSLGYSFLNEDKYYDAFEMKLIPYDDLYQLKYFDDEWIGTIDYDITTTESMTTCNEKEYNIVRTPLGDFVIAMLEDRSDRNKYEISRINLKKMPEEMFLKDFDGEKNIKRLIRGKKK